MNFLHSIIADARPRNPVGETPWAVPHVEWRTRESNWLTPEPREFSSNIEEPVGNSTHLPRKISSTSPEIKKEFSDIRENENYFNLNEDNNTDSEINHEKDQVNRHSVFDSINSSENFKSIPTKKDPTGDKSFIMPENNNSGRNDLTTSNDYWENQDTFQRTSLITGDQQNILSEKEYRVFFEQEKNEEPAKVFSSRIREEFSDKIYTVMNADNQRINTDESTNTPPLQPGKNDYSDSNQNPHGININEQSDNSPSIFLNTINRSQSNDMNNVITHAGKNNQLQNKQEDKDITTTSNVLNPPVSETASKKKNIQPNSPPSDSPGFAVINAEEGKQHSSQNLRSHKDSEILSLTNTKPTQPKLINNNKFSFISPPAHNIKKDESPKVQIGQIDVIITAPAQPASKPIQTKSTSDLSSRYYLRRL